jgi:hypothetical protein
MVVDQSADCIPSHNPTVIFNGWNVTIRRKWLESGLQPLPRLEDRYSITIDGGTPFVPGTICFLFGGCVLEAAEEIPHLFQDLRWLF